MKEFIKNNKKLVSISSLVFVAVIFIVIVAINASKAGTDVQIDGDLYINASAPTKDANGIYVYTGELYTKKETKKVKSLDISFNNCKDGKSITLHGYVNQEIEYGETVTVNASTDKELVNCKISYHVNYITEEVPEENTEENTEEGSGE